MKRQKRRGDSDPLRERELLVLAYLGDQLAPPDQARFRQELQDPDFCRLLAEYSLDEAALYEIGQGGMIGSDLKPARLAWQRRRRVVVVAQLAILILITFLILQFGLREPFGRVVAHVKRVEGNVTVDGRVVAEQAEIRAGSEIRTGDVMGFVEWVYPDGTLLSLRGESTLICDQSDRRLGVHLARGSLFASVEPQPTSRPMIVETEQARIEVVGTQLAVSASDSLTRLDVTEGQVSMKRTTDGTEVDVLAGYYAIASPQRPLQAAAIVDVPDLVDLPFDSGLPEGWGRGQWLQEDPEQPEFGLVRAERPRGMKHYAVHAQNRWNQGWFRIQEDSVLHFRFKQEDPGFYQIIIGTRNGSFGRSDKDGNFEFQETGVTRGRPGEYRTVSVPLSEFKRCRKGQSPRFSARPHDPPALGDIVYLFFFSTQARERGMVFDRIWVTRGQDAPDAS